MPIEPMLPCSLGVMLISSLKPPLFSSVAQSCPTLCDPINRSMPGLPVHHQLPDFTQIHVHRVSDAIQPSHPLSSPSPPAPNPSQHQSLFQWVNSSLEVAKVLEFAILQCKIKRFFLLLLFCFYHQQLCSSHPHFQPSFSQSSSKGFLSQKTFFSQLSLS